jgi:hemoglobin
VYNIATVIDDLIDRVMTDDRLNANPRVDEAHHRVSPAGFKYYVTEMACQAAGGPQQYSGRSMGDSHRHLEITEEEWGAFMDDLRQTLNKFDVPPPRQGKLRRSSSQPTMPSSSYAAPVGDALTRADETAASEPASEGAGRRGRGRFVVAVPGEVNDGRELNASDLTDAACSVTVARPDDTGPGK